MTRSFLGSGTTLTEIEHALTEELIRFLPEHLRGTVEAQFEVYNLVQREIDGRALNFYPSRSRGAAAGNKMPVLTMDVDEAPLMRITVSICDESKPIHATLNAVNGRAFFVAFSRRVDGYPHGTSMSVTGHKDAWRSNFTPKITQEGEQASSSNGG